ncbi:hypothetical protein ACM64Y_00650 [Novispirillum sp. DQ9]|uniref:hypothetical protein n=1 Tax=Novispirillum sp. DQ9 TaxID=3398612 RepID=UPI003C7DD79F
MADSVQSFRQAINVFADKTLAPEALSGHLAAFAKGWLDDAVASGKASPFYTRSVDGVEGAPESSVRPDGVIVYRFSVIQEAAAFALAFLVNRSPLRTGRYAKSWKISVDGAWYDGDVFAIPTGKEIIITNDQPYHRRVATGSEGFERYKRMMEDARQAVMRRWSGGVLEVERAFVDIPGAYRLKGPGRRKKADGSWSIRSDVMAGDRLTYPALIIRQAW